MTTAFVEAARNFGLDEQPAHHDRYERAAEFVEVVAQAVGLAGRTTRRSATRRRASGATRRASTRSTTSASTSRWPVPLTTPRSPQAHPLLVQAGSSEDGKDLAARYAEAVFTAQQTLEDAQAFYTDLKRRAVEWGRDPATVIVLPGIVPVIGATEAEAREKEDELDRLIKPEYARVQLAKTLRVDPDDLPLDRELPADLPSEDEIEGAKSRYTLIVNLARRERLTVRQLIGRLGGGRGHRTFSGTPVQVADAIQDWYDQGAADGFNIMPAVLPSGLEDFVDDVVPILVERGLFRSEYDGDHPARALRPGAPGQPAHAGPDGGGRAMTRQLHLNLFVYPGGHHEAAWRYRESAPERVLDLSYYVELARAAEAATFDGLFLADGPSLADNIAYATRFRLEPFTLLSALAASTTHLGLIGTASTTYSEPYNLARQFAGLDHVSAGRAGWNIVTTGAPGAAQNFGLDEHPTHADRYERADEFLDVVTALWDSWEDDAVVGDRLTGQYADTDRIHRIDHVGPHFSVRGTAQHPAHPAGPPGLRAGRDLASGHERSRRAGRTRCSPPTRRSRRRRRTTPTCARRRRATAATPTACSSCRASARTSARRRPRRRRSSASSTS